LVQHGSPPRVVGDITPGAGRTSSLFCLERARLGRGRPRSAGRSVQRRDESATGPGRHRTYL